LPQSPRVEEIVRIERVTSAASHQTKKKQKQSLNKKKKEKNQKKNKNKFKTTDDKNIDIPATLTQKTEPVQRIFCSTYPTKKKKIKPIKRNKMLPQIAGK